MSGSYAKSKKCPTGTQSGKQGAKRKGLLTECVGRAAGDGEFSRIIEAAEHLEVVRGAQLLQDSDTHRPGRVLGGDEDAEDLLTPLEAGALPPCRPGCPPMPISVKP
jgi:hypothetical protein